MDNDLLNLTDLEILHLKQISNTNEKCGFSYLWNDFLFSSDYGVITFLSIDALRRGMWNYFLSDFFEF